MFLQLSSKSKLERNLIAKEHKASLGFGLAKCNFSFLENVLKGKYKFFFQINNISR